MAKRVCAYALCLAALGAALCGCAGRAETADFFAMDTFIHLEAYGADASGALAECGEEMRRLEGLLSVTSAEGDIYRINHANGEAVRVSDETAALLTDAVAVSRETDGAFDPTVYPLVEVWGFLGDEQRVPDPQALSERLFLVGYQKLSVADGMAALPAGGGVDLGGIAKGYATDRLVALLRQRGIARALLSLGGNVYALGSKPGGRAWRIGVQSPFDAGAVVGVVEARDLAVVTAGSYQRYFTQNGVTYHHILDPQTGYPADSGLASVTVVCESAARADALSTALFVMGLDRALAFWRASGAFSAIFVCADGSVAYTENAPFVPTGASARELSK